jgi:hypothetical protein
MSGTRKDFTQRDHDLKAVAEGNAPISEFMAAYGIKRDALSAAFYNLNEKLKRHGLPRLRWNPMFEGNDADFAGFGAAPERTEKASEMPVKRVIAPRVNAIKGGMEKADPEALWEQMKSAASNHIVRHQESRKIRVEIDADGPVGIAFFGDQHLDAPGCGLAQAEADARLVAQTPGLYAILTGDINDLARLKPFGAMGRQVNPADGLIATRYYLDLFAGKVIASHTGNHDEWLSKCSSLPGFGDVANAAGVVWTEHRANVSLSVGEEEYILYTAHQGQHNSTMNLTHSNFRALERCDDVPAEADVIVISHSHCRSVETRPWKGKDRVAIRPGSYKIVDGLYNRMGMNCHAAGVGVLLWPDRHMVMGCMIETMSEFLRRFYGAN